MICSPSLSAMVTGEKSDFRFHGRHAGTLNSQRIVSSHAGGDASVMEFLLKHAFVLVFSLADAACHESNGRGRRPCV